MKAVFTMTKEQADREFKYQTTKYLMNLMLKNEVINEKDFKKINVKLLEKFKPILGRLSC